MKYRNSVKIDYTNWKGVRRVRRIIPMSLSYGSTQYHPDEQWLMEAMDLEDNHSIKTFAVKDIHSWEPELLDENSPGSSEPRTISQWQKTVLDLAKEKGFHTSDPINSIWKMLGNLHGEVSEAWELARMPDFDPKKLGKMRRASSTAFQQNSLIL